MCWNKSTSILWKNLWHYFVSYSYNKFWNINKLVEACAGFLRFLRICNCNIFFSFSRWMPTVFPYSNTFKMFSLKSNIRKSELYSLILSLFFFFSSEKKGWFSVVAFSLVGLILKLSLSKYCYLIPF